MSRAAGKTRAEKTQKPKRSVPALGMSVEEFCEAYSIKVNLFYELLKAGKGPRCMLLGRRRIITQEAALAWQRQREAEAAVA
jgi:hypothetical protein